MVANYTYDAYGNIIDPFVRAGYGHIGDANAYNYRGYRYDSEINLYYLNSRYYNSEVGRFINSDGILGSVEEILTTNMYSYCLNNPINNIDPSGYWVISLIGITVSFRGMFTGGSISVYLVQDNRGNIGVLLTVAVGLNLPSAGMSVTWSPFFSWRRTIYDLKGLNGIFGASGGAGIYSAGADLLYDADGMLGIQLNIGFGVSFPINFEAHGYFAYSVLFPINRRSMIGTSSILRFVNEIKRAINTVINYGG